MRIRLLLSLIAFETLCSMGSAYSQQASSGAILQLPYKSVALTSAIHLGAGEKRYGNGHLVSVTTRQAPSGTANVYLSDDTGKDELPLVFTPQHDAMLVQLLFGIADTPTHILVTGRAIKDTGGTTQFIAGQNTDGTHPQVLHTGHFLAVQACQSDDHTLWAIGREMPPKEGAVYPVLRHYSFSGEKLASYVSNATHEVKDLPILEKSNSSIYLSCIHNDVLFYDGLNHEITSYYSATDSVKTLQVNQSVSAGLQPTGFGVDPSGHLFASWQQSVAPTLLGQPIIMMLEPSPETSSAQWAPLTMKVSNSATQEPNRLVGATGHYIVLLANDTSTSISMLTWSQVEIKNHN